MSKSGHHSGKSNNDRSNGMNPNNAQYHANRQNSIQQGHPVPPLPPTATPPTPASK